MMLRGNKIDRPIEAEVIEQVLRRLTLTGALGYVAEVGLKTDDSDLTSAFQKSRIQFKLDAMHTNYLCLKRTVDVSETLEQAGLSHIIVKGPLRQLQTFGDAYTRPSKDTDILVAPKDFEAAINALKANGYRPGMDARYEKWYKNFQGQLHMVDDQVLGWSVDLHKYLTTPQAGWETDHDQWFRGISYASPVLHEKQQLHLPIPNVQFANLISVLNIVKSLHGRSAENKTLSGWRRSTLAHVCDLYMQLKHMPDEEIDMFLEHAKNAGLLSSTLLALRVVQAVFDRPIDPLAHYRTVLAEIRDEDLVNIIISPEDVTTWPTPHYLLIDLCQGDLKKMIRHLSRYLVSILARRVLLPKPTHSTQN